MGLPPDVSGSRHQAPRLRCPLQAVLTSARCRPTCLGYLLAGLTEYGRSKHTINSPPYHVTSDDDSPCTWSAWASTASPATAFFAVAKASFPSCCTVLDASGGTTAPVVGSTRRTCNDSVATLCCCTGLVGSPQQHRVDNRAYRHPCIDAAHRGLIPVSTDNGTCPLGTTVSAPSAIAAISALFLSLSEPTSGTRPAAESGGSEKPPRFRLHASRYTTVHLLDDPGLIQLTLAPLKYTGTPGYDDS